MISQRILTFATAVVLLFVACPVLFPAALPPFPLLQSADLIEFGAPFVIVPLYWWMFDGAGVGAPERRQVVVFILFTTLWVIGVGTHLAGNSIQHLMDQGGAGAPAYELARFYHKPLSHYVQSIGLIGLATALIHRESVQGSTGERDGLWLEGLAAVFYGFAFFCLHVSGRIAPIGIAYSLAVAVYGVVQWTRIRHRPVLAFFLMSQTLNLVLCIGWAIHWDGMPNFSETGIIK